jgi:hypothetical protein
MYVRKRLPQAVSCDSTPYELQVNFSRRECEQGKKWLLIQRPEDLNGGKCEMEEGSDA